MYVEQCAKSYFPGVGMPTDTPRCVDGLHLPHTTVSPPAQKHFPTPLVGCGIMCMSALKTKLQTTLG